MTMGADPEEGCPATTGRCSGMSITGTVSAKAAAASEGRLTRRTTLAPDGEAEASDW
jgi:hypothetical protein